MRLLRIPVLVLLILSFLALEVNHAGDAHWPRFRGPNGTGISHDKDIPVTWTESAGVLWKVPLSGAGHSSPIIWGDRLFFHAASDDARQRTLLCLDSRTGKSLWSRSVPAKMGEVHRTKGTLAASTPTTDGQRVYVVFWDGEALAMHAFDFDGNLIWNRDLGLFKQIKPTTHGAGNSPIEFNGRIYFANEQDESAALLCLEARTGKLLWEKARPGFRTCYSTPFILQKPMAGPELIVSSTAGITSYSPVTGQENWTYTWTFLGKPLRTVGSPVDAGGIVVATSGDGSGDRHAIAVNADAKGDVTKTNLVWENTKSLPYVPTPLFHEGHLYLVSDRGVASCYKALTGEPVWSERLGGDVSASPVLISGKVYVFSEVGDAHVFKAAPNFEKLGKSSIGEPVLATPAVAGGRLFIRGKSHLYCIGKAEQ